MSTSFILITFGFVITVTTSFWAARPVSDLDPFLA